MVSDLGDAGAVAIGRRQIGMKKTRPQAGALRGSYEHLCVGT